MTTELRAQAFRERIAYRRWQAAVRVRDSIDPYDRERHAAAATEVRRLERIWAAHWDAGRRLQNGQVR